MSTGGRDDDLGATAVGDALAGRPRRVYPAMVSAEADAIAWARTGGPVGGVVVAGYQMSGRRRDGRAWEPEVGRGFGFSMLVPARGEEGQWYLVAALAVVSAMPAANGFWWPDEVRAGSDLVAAVSVHSDSDHEEPEWRVLTMLLPDVEPPRAPVLAAIVAAVEHHAARPPADVADDYRAGCAALGERVVARLVPLGPSGVTIEGMAADCRADGSLVVETDGGRRAVVPAEAIGVLERA